MSIWYCDTSNAESPFYCSGANDVISYQNAGDWIIDGAEYQVAYNCPQGADYENHYECDNWESRVKPHFNNKYGEGFVDEEIVFYDNAWSALVECFGNCFSPCDQTNYDFFGDDDTFYLIYPECVGIPFRSGYFSSIDDLQAIYKHLNIDGRDGYKIERESGIFNQPGDLCHPADIGKVGCCGALQNKSYHNLLIHILDKYLVLYKSKHL